MKLISGGWRVMFRPFKDAEKSFNGEISFDEFMNSCILEMEVGIRYMLENLKTFEIYDIIEL